MQVTTDPICHPGLALGYQLLSSLSLLRNCGRRASDCYRLSGGELDEVRPRNDSRTWSRNPVIMMSLLSERFACYTFHSTWRVEASMSDTYGVLYDLEGYPSWWPEVKEVRRIDASRANVCIRTAFAYSLQLRLEKETSDQPAGLLRTRISGDLEGWSSWSITPIGRGCRLEFNEEVMARKGLLRALGPIARPLFRLNHALMMRHGEQGLRQLFAAPLPPCTSAAASQLNAEERPAHKLSTEEGKQRRRRCGLPQRRRGSDEH
ncbi:MAG: SRPBCC family protein [Nitriliruptorales bacterium]